MTRRWMAARVGAWAVGIPALLVGPVQFARTESPVWLVVMAVGIVLIEVAWILGD